MPPGVPTPPSGPLKVFKSRSRMAQGAFLLHRLVEGPRLGRYPAVGDLFFSCLGSLLGRDAAVDRGSHQCNGLSLIHGSSSARCGLVGSELCLSLRSASKSCWKFDVELMREPYRGLCLSPTFTSAGPSQIGYMLAFEAELAHRPAAGALVCAWSEMGRIDTSHSIERRMEAPCPMLPGRH